MLSKDDKATELNSTINEIIADYRKAQEPKKRKKVEEFPRFSLEDVIPKKLEETENKSDGYFSINEELFERSSPIAMERIEKIKDLFKSLTDQLWSEHERVMFYICQNTSNIADKTYSNVSPNL